jgi:hypothetical protein
MAKLVLVRHSSQIGRIYMNKGIRDTTDDLGNKRFYHGTRAELRPGDMIEPGNPPDSGDRDGMTIHVYLTPNLDEAIWDAELAVGEGPGVSLYSRAHRPSRRGL